MHYFYVIAHGYCGKLDVQCEGECQRNNLPTESETALGTYNYAAWLKKYDSPVYWFSAERDLHEYLLLKEWDEKTLDTMDGKLW